MSDRTFGWDLPPGVSVNDIPGNRPEDEVWENIYDNFWDKERLTKTHNGIRINEKEYEQMDKLYLTKGAEMIDSYITAAIEYGMEIGEKQAKAYIQEERENLISEMAYACYKFNRQRSPDVSPERWSKIFSHTDLLEERYQGELKGIV